MAGESAVNTEYQTRRSVTVDSLYPVWYFFRLVNYTRAKKQQCDSLKNKGVCMPLKVYPVVKATHPNDSVTVIFRDKLNRTYSEGWAKNRGDAIAAARNKLPPPGIFKAFQHWYKEYGRTLPPNVPVRFIADEDDFFHGYWRRFVGRKLEYYGSGTELENHFEDVYFGTFQVYENVEWPELDDGDLKNADGYEPSLPEAAMTKGELWEAYGDELTDDIPPGMAEQAQRFFKASQLPAILFFPVTNEKGASVSTPFWVNGAGLSPGTVKRIVRVTKKPETKGDDLQRTSTTS